jgi:protein ImuB
MSLMARAFGDVPDPRPDFAFPDRFDLSLELPAPVETASALLFAARRLTLALAGWLEVRQAGIREVTLRLLHRRDETPLPLHFADLTRDGVRFERMLRARLERMVLKAPVESLRLEVVNVASLPGRSGVLFDNADAARDAMNVLLERLRARLGDERVYRLASCADHRPECATRQVSFTTADKAAGKERTSSHRPFWLLDKPESLPEVDGRPYRRGPLQLLVGPERIESGWWDGGEAAGDVRRDYFVAHSADARWLWIYRECQMPGGWFLHGFFS